MKLQSIILDDLRESLDLHSKLESSTELIEQLSALALVCVDAIRANAPIFFAGNGGSFANAQHLAAEFTGKMGRMRESLPAIALGTNNSSISAIGNDFGYEEIFSREFLALRRDKSVVIALSTSGNSRNILKLVTSSIASQNPVFAITGADGGQVSNLCQTIKVPSRRTERIQEIEILFGHSLCFAIEEELGIFK